MWERYKLYLSLRTSHHIIVSELCYSYCITVTLRNIILKRLLVYRRTMLWLLIHAVTYGRTHSHFNTQHG